MIALAVGQLWRENDDRYRIEGASPHRHVRIEKISADGSRVLISNVPPYRPRTTETAAARFGADGKTGFTFVAESVSNVPRPSVAETLQQARENVRPTVEAEERNTTHYPLTKGK